MPGILHTSPAIAISLQGAHLQMKNLSPRVNNLTSLRSQSISMIDQNETQVSLIFSTEKASSTMAPAPLDIAVACPYFVPISLQSSQGLSLSSTESKHRPGTLQHSK